MLFRVVADDRGRVTRRAPELLVDILLIAVAAVWGASFLAAKELVAETGIAPGVALRFLIAAIALGILCLLRRERMPRSYFIAAVAAVAGVALLVSGGGLRAPNPGDALVIAAAVVRAVHVTASGRLTRGREDSTLGVVFVQLAVCALASTAVAGADLPPAVAGLSASGWVDVIFLGLLCSVFAFVVQLWAVRRTSATRASILMGTEPVWALAMGVAIGGEAVGLPGLAGAALIVAASYAGQAVERRHRRSLDQASGGIDGRAVSSGPLPVDATAPTPSL